VASGLVSGSGSRHLDIGEMMSLDIYFSDDIRNALLAADKASSSTAAYCPDGPTLQAYLKGYRAALTTVALAFGLSPSVIGDRRGQTVEIGARDVPGLETHNVR